MVSKGCTRLTDASRPRHSSPRSSSTMQTLAYAHFPDNISAVHVALFANVTNAPAIRARIVKAATMQGPEGDAERELINFAFVEAKLVRAHPCQRQ